MNEYYNNHYLTVNAHGLITDGWSDGPHSHREVTEDDFLINDKGGYQFRLILDGEQTEENPPLYTFDGLPLYRWDGETVIRRSEDEIKAERAARPAPLPTAEEQLRADVDFIAAMTGVSL